MDNNQIYLFAIYTICGVIIGLWFDIFRILRKAFKTSDIATYIEDILFGILTGIFLIAMLFIFNNGQLRFFIFVAIASRSDFIFTYTKQIFYKNKCENYNILEKSNNKNNFYYNIPY